MHPLDQPIWSALTGPQASLAEVRGQARRFPSEVSPLAAIQPGSLAYDDLRALTEPGGGLGLFESEVADPGAGWRVVQVFTIQQLVCRQPMDRTDLEVTELGPADRVEMQDLVQRTEPGPFGPRTPELGRYVGVRLDGRLVAMAGERLRPPGFVEISAVCTDPTYRGRGLGGALVQVVAHGIQAGGDVPFLHVLGSNSGAIRLYEALGFETRRELTVSVLVAEH